MAVFDYRILNIETRVLSKPDDVVATDIIDAASQIARYVARWWRPERFAIYSIQLRTGPDAVKETPADASTPFGKPLTEAERRARDEWFAERDRAERNRESL